MRVNKFEQKRLRNRIRGWNYSENGWYFITICVHNMMQCFGKVENGKMKLNEFGKIAYRHWEIIPDFYTNIEIDKFIVMPNHIHGIIIINNVVTGQWSVITNKNSKYTISNVVTGQWSVTTNQNIVNPTKNIISNVVTGQCPVTTNKNSKNIISNVVTGQWPVTTNNDFHYGLISKIINKFKGIVSKEIHQFGFSNFKWQRSFYDRIIRNETELLIKQRYILNNPMKWELDKYNPKGIKTKKVFE